MEKIYQIALSNVDGVGSVFFRQLISYCGSAENVFKAKTDKLLKVPGVGKTVIEGLKKKDLLPDAEKTLKEAEKQGVQLFFSTDKNYPSRLKPLYDAPAVLYYKGTTNLDHHRSIGIVGTRQATDYGKKVTESIVEESKNYNPLIVSGLAYGIDIAAHLLPKVEQWSRPSLPIIIIEKYLPFLAHWQTKFRRAAINSFRKIKPIFTPKSTTSLKL